MDYPTHYDRLIARAKGRSLTGYRERHHILPRCMDGTDAPENIVALTAEEHYVAHQLLVKMYPRNGRIAHAAVWMAKRCSGNKAYGWLRRRHALATSKAMQGNQSWTGRKHTEEWKAQRWAAQLGTVMPREAVEKMAASKRGKPLSAQHRARISASGRGLQRSEKTRAKIAAARSGKALSAEHGKKIAEANRRRVFSPETRAKMSASRRAYCAARRAA